MAPEFELRIELAAVSAEPASDPLSRSLSLLLPGHTLSLPKINTAFKKGSGRSQICLHPGITWGASKNINAWATPLEIVT